MLRIKSMVRVLALISVMTLLLTACKEKDASDELLEGSLKAPEQGNYKTDTVERGDYIIEGKCLAELCFPNVAPLSPESENSRLRELLVSEGDEVKAGQVLVNLSVEGSEAELEEKRVVLQNAREDKNRETENKRSEIERAEAALSGLSGIDAELKNFELQALRENYNAYLRETEYQIARLEEELRTMEERLGATQIVAPFDGKVQSVSTDFHVGDKVNPGDTLVTVYDPNVYYLQVDDSEAKLSYNMEVAVEASRRDESAVYTGRVVSAGDSVSYKVKDNNTYIKLDTPPDVDKLLGMSLSVSAQTLRLEDVLLIDRKALYNDEKKNFVYLLEDGSLRKRYVAVGDRGKDQVWITDGLKEGQTIVLD